MKLRIFAIKDRATDQFGTPMFLISTGQAIRSFADEVNREDKQNQLYTHPDDFDLYDLGEFETDQGRFKTIDPKTITLGKEVKIRTDKK